MIEVKDYLYSKGLEFKAERQEYKLKTCPFCNDSKWHFYISQEGVYYCHKCTSKGSFYQLRKKLGDIAVMDFKDTLQGKEKRIVRPTENIVQLHNALLDSQLAMDYLTGRRIFQEAIKKFTLGLKKIEGIDCLAIPHMRQGQVINIKFRFLPPAEKDFRRVKDCESILFNEDCIKDHSEIIIVESEIDAITLLQAGFENVVGLTVGAKTFKPEWYDRLKDKEKIYICLNNDRDGQIGARDIAKRLGLDKCFQIALPDEVNDINELFCQGGNREEFELLLASARAFPVDNTLHVSQVAEDYFSQQDGEREKDENETINTPWVSGNRLIGKEFHRGNLIVLSAPPKMGKTMLALQIVKHNLGKGHPCFFYCLEMSPREIFGRFLTMYLGGARQLTPDEKDELIYRLEDVPFIQGFNQTGLSVETVLNTIRETVRRYGIKLVVLDHLHFLVRGYQQTEQLGSLVREIKSLAQELEIVFLLIAQPRKIDLDKPMTMFDLKYASEIASDCDMLLTLQRKRLDPEEEAEASFSAQAVFRVEAAREVGGGLVKLKFDSTTLMFEEIRDKCNEGSTRKNAYR